MKHFKLTIASDIHGSAECCKLLLEAHRREGSGRLLLLGDILYHGPRNGLFDGYDPKAVADMLNEYADEILAVRGNCDSEVDQMMLSFPIMSEQALLVNAGFAALLLHGHKGMEKLPLKGINMVLSGHTHVPASIIKDGILWANPGSVSLPKEGSERSYMIWENGTVLWKTLSGEVYKSVDLQILCNNPNI